VGQSRRIFDYRIVPKKVLFVDKGGGAEHCGKVANDGRCGWIGVVRAADTKARIGIPGFVCFSISFL
jgi:hypothetical protein